MLTDADAVPVELGFLPTDQAIEDPDHPGLLRAGPRAAAPYGDDRVEFHLCSATDLSESGADLPDLLRHGVDTVDLSGLEALQVACARVLAAGRVEDEDAAAVRNALEGAELRCASGHTLTVKFLAGEGFFMRTVGPDRMSMVAPQSEGMNEHGGASSVHADQDVYGTPLLQLMDGRAPDLFQHDSPNGENHDAELLLVNLWIPLQQIVQPLVLGDGRTIDRRRHQLRFGLRTTSFLDRDEDMEINDIWAFLHDDAQEWYFRSDMDHRSAWVFNTLSTPHGSGVLPGEDVAAQLVRAVDAAESAAGQGDAAAVAAAVAEVVQLEVPAGVPAPLVPAIDELLAVCRAAAGDPAGVAAGQADGWAGRAQAATRRVVRMSLELRLVVSVVEPS
jgi:hypothetical protein